METCSNRPRTLEPRSPPHKDCRKLPDELQKAHKKVTFLALGGPAGACSFLPHSLAKHQRRRHGYCRLFDQSSPLIWIVKTLVTHWGSCSSRVHSICTQLGVDAEEIHGPETPLSSSSLGPLPRPRRPGEMILISQHTGLKAGRASSFVCLPQTLRVCICACLH